MKRFLLLLALLVPSVSSATFFTDLVDKSVVVHVKLKGKDKKWHRGGCSGTFVSGNTILTAAHCFDSSEFFVWARDDKDRSYLCTLVKRDAAKDLALLAVATTGHVYASIGLPEYLGEPIWNVGSPFGLNFLLSQGIISKLNNRMETFTGTYTITTAMINPGSSGGGVFDGEGRLIGVNTMTIGGMFGWAGITCAVDLQTVKEFLR